MTDEQQVKIKELRLKGLGYKAIANQVGQTRDVIRNYCKQHELAGHGCVVGLNVSEKKQKNILCLSCLKPLKQNKRGKTRLFCSDACRRKWWKEHQEASSPKATAIYYFTCIHCGKEFTAYGNKARKYCSHDCYIKNRFWEDEENGVSEIKN